MATVAVEQGIAVLPDNHYVRGACQFMAKFCTCLVHVHRYVPPKIIEDCQ